MARRATEAARRWPDILRGARVLALLGAAGLGGCATTPVAAPAETTNAAAWPEDWGIKFALRCSEAGEDVRVCVCLANEIQRKWNPEQFQVRESCAAGSGRHGELDFQDPILGAWRQE